MAKQVKNKSGWTPLQIAVHVGAMVPLLWLAWDFWRGNAALEINPFQFITLRTGKAALILLLLSLACTPLHTLFGWRQVLLWRKPLGLYAFLYGLLHFSIFVVDNGYIGDSLDLLAVYAATFEKRFALAGFAAAAARLGLKFNPLAAREALAKAFMPGRLQRVTCGGRTVWLDVAHNRQAAAVLARWLALNPVPGRTLAVFAALADKDIAAIVAALDGAVDAWYLAGLDDAGTRSRSVEGLAAAMPARCRVAALAPEVATALARALADAQDQEDRVIVFGSFHTVAAALRVCAASGGPVALDAIERN